MKNINLTAPINPLSYGIVSLNVLKQLSKTHNVAYFPKGQPEPPPEDQELVLKAYQNTDIFDNNADSILIWHQFDMAHHVGKGRHIGWPIFELNRFTQREITHLASQDRLIVCSKWAREILLRNNVTSEYYVDVVPLGYDPAIFFPNPTRSDFVVTDCQTPTRFITVGKWEYRKGYDKLLECFESAFSPEDNVELVILSGSLILKNSRPDLVKQWEDYYRGSRLASKIKVIAWVDEQRDVANWMRRSDCFISLSRAEGFNLGAIEAMACGLELIITNYSAHTEFSNKDNAFLVEVDQTEAAYDGIWFDGKTGEWASLEQNQIDQTVDYMRTIHALKKDNPNKSNAAGLATAKEFTWEKMGGRLGVIL